MQRRYFERILYDCQKLLKEFLHVSFQHILRAQNQEANRLAQSASGYRVFWEVLSSETSNDDWRVEIADYLRNPSQKVARKLRYKSTKYVLLDDQLYYKTVNGVLLKCLIKRKLRCWWARCMKGYVELINRLIRWNGLFPELDIFGQQYWKTILNIIRGARTVNILVMSRNHPHRPWIR